MSDQDPNTLPRRHALKLVLAGTAGAPLAGLAATPEPPAAARPGTDPDLVRPVVPWQSVLNETELNTAAALCDVILPADERSPAASAAGVHRFIDEWISAPYPDQHRDRGVVRGGLAWLNTESVKRHGRPFAELDAAQQAAICDDILDGANATTPDWRQAANFFDVFRRLTIGGYYTTEAGRRDLDFRGNRALDRFTGATPEQLRHLGLA